MCGRFTLFSSQDSIESFLGIEVPEYKESYNISPSNMVLIAVNSGWKAGFLKWGLIPSWSEDKKIARKLMNARSETIDEKPSFRYLLSRRRCIVLADGFYEWKKVNGTKKPHRIIVNDDLFAFAGLWDIWKNDSEEISTCTLITCEPNQLMRDIHDRMPAILNKEQRVLWMDKSIKDKQELKEILRPYPDEEMSAYEVSTEVNNPKNDNRDLILAV